MYPTLHTGIAGSKFFKELPDDFRPAILGDFYLFGELRTDTPFLLLNSKGEYEAYRTNASVWEDYKASIVELLKLGRVFIYEKL